MDHYQEPKNLTPEHRQNNYQKPVPPQKKKEKKRKNMILIRCTYNHYFVLPYNHIQEKIIKKKKLHNFGQVGKLTM